MIVEPGYFNLRTSFTKKKGKKRDTKSMIDWRVWGIGVAEKPRHVVTVSFVLVLLLCSCYDAPFQKNLLSQRLFLWRRA